jgi:hypothetical protein
MIGMDDLICFTPNFIQDKSVLYDVTPLELESTFDRKLLKQSVAHIPSIYKLT